MTDKPLNKRQADFLKYYLESGNATQSAKKAGYSKKTAQQAGAQLLSNSVIRAAVQASAAKALSKIEITADKVLQEHAKMANSNMLDFVDIDKHGRPLINLNKATREQFAAIKTIKVTELPPLTIVSNGEELQREVLKTEITLHDKPKTNWDLAKHLKIAGETAQELPPTGDTYIQNNYMNMPPLEIMKRVALMMYRGTMPAVPQPSGGSNSGMVAKSPTGSKDKG